LFCFVYLYCFCVSFASAFTIATCAVSMAH
jgi:hypothetical protein